MSPEAKQEENGFLPYEERVIMSLILQFGIGRKGENDGTNFAFGYGGFYK